MTVVLLQSVQRMIRVRHPIVCLVVSAIPFPCIRNIIEMFF